MSMAGFNRLDHEITDQYLAKAYSRAAAEHIGRATAGRVANARHRKYGVPPKVRRAQSCVSREMKGRKFESREAQQEAFADAVHTCKERERKRVRPSRRRR